MAEKRKHVVFAEEDDQPTAGPSRLHANGVHPDRQALVPNGGAASGSTEAQEKQKKQKVCSALLQRPRLLLMSDRGSTAICRQEGETVSQIEGRQKGCSAEKQELATACCKL